MASLPNTKSGVSLEDRLEHGSLTVAEVMDLAKVSRTKFYADVKAGVVEIYKRGRASRVCGPVAKRYSVGAA